MAVTIKEEVVTTTVQDKKFWIGYRLKYRQGAKERDPFYTNDRLCYTDLEKLIKDILRFQEWEDGKDPGYGHDYKIFDHTGYDCRLEDGPKRPNPGMTIMTQYGEITYN